LTTPPAPDRALAVAEAALGTSPLLAQANLTGWTKTIAMVALQAAAPLIIREAAASQFEDAIRSATDAVMAEKLPAMEAAIRADENKRRMPGSELYMAGVRAERQRIRELAAEHKAICAVDPQAAFTASMPFADLIGDPDE
jgi:hypothetical protein